MNDDEFYEPHFVAIRALTRNVIEYILQKQQTDPSTPANEQKEPTSPEDRD